MAKKKITETQEEAVVKMETAAAAPKKRTTAAKHKPATKKSAVKPAEAAIEAPAPAAPVAPAVPVEVTTAQIARLAYSFWEARGYAPGDPNEDWLRAERELHARAAQA
jgi:hypothetical protein